MSFRHWIKTQEQPCFALLENATVAQWLKSQHLLPVGQVRQSVQQALTGIPFIQQSKQQVQQQFLNFFAAQYIVNRQNLLMPRQRQLLQNAEDPNLQRKWEAAIMPDSAGDFVARKWQEWGAFFAANYPVIKSKLNSVEYTVNHVDRDVEQWHLDLQAKERTMPSENYQIALTLDHLGGAWKGWKWVNLERGSCGEEGDAMGHCGNSGGYEDDNILSLRDSQGYAHLTFIVNNKMLGESKGRNNSKPSQRYHPPIMELLKSDLIAVIQGGGYKPENNFEFNDLEKEQQEHLNQSKPYINDFVEYAINTDPWMLYSKLGLDKSDKPRMEEDGFVLMNFPDISDLEDIVYVENSNLDAFFGEDSYDMYSNNDYHPSYNDLTLDDEVEGLIMQYVKQEGIDVDNPSDAHEESDEIQMALQTAYSYGHEAGASREAWAILKKTLSDGKDGFSVDMENHPWALRISKDDLRSFMAEDNEDEYGEFNLANYLKENKAFEFEVPYYGFTDFDDEHFLDSAKEQIGDLLHSKVLN